MEELVAYHAVAAGDVLVHVGGRKDGLRPDDVVQSRKLHGANALPKQRRRSALLLFLRQLSGPFMVVLALACAVSLIVGDRMDAVLIAIIMAVHSVLGFLQEFRADRAFERLSRYLPQKARVRRNGEVQIIPSHEVVVGDVIVCEAGDSVVADARILSATMLETNEAALTGEAKPVAKDTKTLPPSTALAERRNMLFAGTVIANGRCEAIVVAVGGSTEFGKIAVIASGTHDERTPLQQQLAKFARTLVVGILVLVAVIFAWGLGKGLPVADMFAVAVALAVAAIPEGLLVTLTVILAVGMQRMLKRNTLVRKLIAAETLGSVSVICADKTGTMTMGEMSVTELYLTDRKVSAQHTEAEPLLQSLALGIAARVDPHGKAIAGSMTELAIARFLLPYRDDLALPQFQLEGELPFDSTHKYSARIFHRDGRRVMKVIGAPDVLLPKADCTDAERGRLTSVIEQLSHRGLRVIMVGERELNDEPVAHALVTDITVLGFVGLDDPVRQHVPALIAQARRAGIRTVMVTGDHPGTARTVALAIGLPADGSTIMTGVELARLDDAVLAARIGEISVFARIQPLDKLRIVKALQALGHTVAMTGDGVNDAPALRAADVGIAVGTGTDVAKEAADIVLLDNDFSTIIEAVREGRGIFDNIRKVVAYLMTSSLSEVVLMFGALALGLPLPLLPLHILWVNLLADGLPSLALAGEPPERGVMEEPPRSRTSPVLRRDMLATMLLAGVLMDVTLLVLLVTMSRANVDIAMIRSFMFGSLGLTSTLYIFSLRSFRKPLLSIPLRTNPWLLGAVAVSLALLAIPFAVPQLREAFGLAPLPGVAIPFLLLVSFVKIFAVETAKFLLISSRRPAHDPLV